jgi:hypothetical protein
MCILTSQNSDTPEALESRFSVRIHRIPAELPHSTELELRKFWQSFHARATVRTPDKPGTPPALSTSPLSLLYKNDLGNTIWGKTPLSSHFLPGGAPGYL